MSVTEYLDQLDEARAKATPGPWREGAQPYVYAEVPDGMPVVADCFADADATLIVAAVNALPQLVAALRAMEAIADDWAQSPTHYRAAYRIRAAITHALGGAA